ncbi:coil containing protein [Vibrio phage LV6]|nr:coil containing protein [Vibrio phage LV6]
MALKIGKLNHNKSRLKKAPKGTTNPTCPADRIAEDSRKILGAANKVLGGQTKNNGGNDAQHAILMKRLDTAHRARSASAAARRQEKLEELHELQKIGFISPNEVAEEMDTERRREEVYKLHLRGFNKSLMANFFKVSVPTITNDLKILRNNLIHELTALGAEGLVSKSYSFYELLQHEVIRRLDHMSIEDHKASVQLIRLAKDIEDSKNRLLSTIGAVKPPRMKDVESIAEGNSDGAPIVTTDVMKDLLTSIGQRMQAVKRGGGEVLEGEVEGKE